jgi:hypothetical protein
MGALAPFSYLVFKEELKDMFKIYNFFCILNF